MAQFNVTELDFDKIKASIKDHFVSQTKYTDWAFDGSGLNVLLDVLAYNTHYNAMVSHFSMNETFLDSAQIRGNVVSHAKLLGYTPRSTIASRATLNVTVEAGVNPPPFLTLERGFRFRSTVNEKPYTFLILDPQQAVLNTTDPSTYPNGRYVFNAVPILQGTLKRMLYVVDNSVQNQKFVIPDQNVDTTTLRVQVKANTQSNDYAAYAKFTTLSGVDPTSTIYFLQENSSGNYEIYFGDGILGKKPISNNIVEIEYIYTDGEVTNGATTFETVDGVSGMIVQPPVTVTKSYGASARESIDSIRYNAPFTFVSQNRAVTSDDYRSIIQNNFGNIEAISVWGGEDAPAPDYGTVYISIKPTGAEYLTTAEKIAIQNVLKGKNVVSITPVLVDPEYTQISLDVFFKYNPNLTNRSKIDLQSVVLAAVGTYNDTNLKRFDGVFRYSQILKQIDSSEPSILNSDCRVFMYKDISATSTGTNYFDLQFSAPIYRTTSTESVMTTNYFKIGGIDHYFGDSPIAGSNDRTVYLYKSIEGNTARVKEVGKIYTLTGRVTIGGFTTDVDTAIRVTVMPNSNDLAPKRNQLLEIDLTTVNVTGEVDTIVVAGSAGAVNYTTPSRHR